MKLTRKQLQDFSCSILDIEAIERVIEWIENNLRPEDVFDQSALCIWAEKNGYTKDK